MELSCVDTIVVIMSDWRDTGSGPSENLKWPRPGIHIYIDWWQVCTILHKGLNIWILLTVTFLQWNRGINCIPQLSVFHKSLFNCVCNDLFPGKALETWIVFLTSEILEGLAQRNGGIKCKKEEKPTAADCLQGAEGQTAPGVANEKLTSQMMRRMVIGNALP